MTLIVLINCHKFLCTEVIKKNKVHKYFCKTKLPIFSTESFTENYFCLIYLWRLPEKKVFGKTNENWYYNPL